jgi:hypothetical protein
MTNLDTEALYSIVLHPNDIFFEECELLFKKNNLDLTLLNNQLRFNFEIKAPFYLSHLYSEKDMINNLKETNVLDLNTLLDKKYKFISTSQVNDNHVMIFEDDQKLNFFKSSIIRSFDVFRKTLDPLEFKKDISRYNNLSEKEFYYYQIWGYPYYYEFSTHHISLLKNKNIDYLESSFSQVQYGSLKLLKQKNINNDDYIELTSIS